MIWTIQIFNRRWSIPNLLTTSHNVRDRLYFQRFLVSLHVAEQLPFFHYFHFVVFHSGHSHGIFFIYFDFIFVNLKSVGGCVIVHCFYWIKQSRLSPVFTYKQLFDLHDVLLVPRLWYFYLIGFYYVLYFGCFRYY